MSLVKWVKGYDQFGQGPAPFNLGGVGKATSVPGGLVGMGIKFLTTTFFLFKLSEMTQFTKPLVQQITIQGTPAELSKIYGEEQLGNTSFAIQIKQPEVSDDDVAAQKAELEELLNYMQISETVVSKKGAKVSLYKEPIIHKDLVDMLKTNSHDYPEIRLHSDEIFFSGSEDSPEKMTIVSTKFALELDYDMIYKKAFENCLANSTCSEIVPTMSQIANQFSSEMLSSGLYTNAEVGDWMEKILYDDSFVELHRVIYQDYKYYIQKKEGEIADLEKEITMRQTR